MTSPAAQRAAEERTGSRTSPSEAAELCPQDEAIVQAAWEEMTGAGVRIRLGSVRRLYLLHLRSVERGDFLSYVLTYLDPTGELGVYEAMKPKPGGAR